MDYFKLRIEEGNKVWRKYFTFAERFLYRNKEIKFTDAYAQKSKLGQLKIQALNQDGVVSNQNIFIKESMPNFCKIRQIFLIKDSIFSRNLFENLYGVEFFPVKVDGKFESDYKLLSFSSVVDCVDFISSERKDFEFMSKLVLEKSKIPATLDGFFLPNWDKYGMYRCIVSERLKNSLLQLEKASEFLIFDKINFGARRVT